MVQDKSNGHLRLVDPGTSAVLHGLMSMLSEVLDGLDRRLDAMESRVVELAERPPPEPPPPPPPAPAPEFDTSDLHEAIDRAAARVTEQVAGHLAEQVAGLAGELTDADERVGRIEQTVVAGLTERLATIEQTVGDRLAHAESALAERMSGLDDAVSDRTIDLMRRLAQVEASLAEGRAEASQVAPRIDELASRVSEQLDERLARLEATLTERLSDRLAAAEAAVTDRVAERLSSVEATFTDKLAQRIAGVETSFSRIDHIGPRIDEVLARVDEAAAHLAEQVAHAQAAAAEIAPRLGDQMGERLTHLEVSVAERLGHVETALADRITGLDDATADRAVDLTRRIAQVETTVNEARADTTNLAPRIDEIAGRVCERVSQAEQMATGHAEQLEARLAMQLAEVDAAVAALRAESAALPANLAEQVQAAIGSWRSRLRRGESDDSIKKAFEDLAAQIADGMSRIQEAVNRAQGESLDAAHTTTAELRKLLDAAQSDQLDAVAAVAEKLVAVHDELGRHDARLVDAVIAAIPEPPEPPAPIAPPEPIVVDTTETIESLRAWIAEELARVRDSVTETHARTGTVATSVARQVDEVVQAAVTAVGDRVGRERTATDGIRRDVELLGTRIEELGKSVSAGRREFAITAQGLPDLLRNVIQENDLGPAIEAVKDAVASANHEHQDVLRALHSSLAKRFDARARTIAETLDGLAAGLEAARAIGPSLDKVGARLEQQQPFLDQMRHELMQLGAAVGAMPADMERRHAEATAGIEGVADALTTLRKHAAALDRAVQSMRASQDGMATAFVDLRDGNGVLPQRLDQIGAAVDVTRRQLGEVGEVTRSVAGGMEQQHAMGNRLAELVTQVRAATRSDIERVESSIHLEVLKQHQQDQARLTQAVAGVSEVVEREAGVIAQRVSALASEVDAIRLELAGTRPDASN